MNTTTNDLASTEIDEATVADYLQRNPDFLARHPHVLAAMHVPHQPGEGVVSLIERQVAVLRARNDELEQRLAIMLRTARENEHVGARLLALGRGLLEADSLDAVLALVRDALLSEFSADAVAIRLIDAGDGELARRAPGRFLRVDAPELEPFADCLRKGRPVCGTLAPEQIEILFADDGRHPRSVALVPLVAGRPLGLIALGSNEADHFRADMGTLFLGQLGELVTTGVARHLEHGQRSATDD